MPGVRRGACQVLQSLRVDESGSGSKTLEKKPVPVVGKDFLSGILANLTGKENTIFFSDDRALLDAEEVLYFCAQAS